MAYIRKTEDEFEILCDYGQGLELVTTETTRPLAREQIRCYRANEPGRAFKIHKRRVPIESK